MAKNVILTTGDELVESAHRKLELVSQGGISNPTHTVALGHAILANAAYLKEIRNLLTAIAKNQKAM